MGMRSSDTHSVMFTDVKVPKENRIGDDGFGFSFAMKTLDGGRIGIASQALGIASGALERAINYAKERKAFGTEICQPSGHRIQTGRHGREESKTPETSV
jgi:alkylation response protein AidB-like acyl-CoA dehydrogenase